MQKRFRMAIKKINSDLDMGSQRDIDTGSDRRKSWGKREFAPISKKKHSCKCNGNCIDCRCREKDKHNENDPSNE